MTHAPDTLPALTNSPAIDDAEDADADAAFEENLMTWEDVRDGYLQPESVL